MYITLTYEERIELIHMLRIKFDDSIVCKQGNYLTSTLRGRTREDFLAMQQEIKKSSIQSMMCRLLSEDISLYQI